VSLEDLSFRSSHAGDLGTDLRLRAAVLDAPGSIAIWLSVSAISNLRVTPFKKFSMTSWTERQDLFWTCRRRDFRGLNSPPFQYPPIRMEVTVSRGPLPGCYPLQFTLASFPSFFTFADDAAHTGPSVFSLSRSASPRRWDGRIDVRCF